MIRIILPNCINTTNKLIAWRLGSLCRQAIINHGNCFCKIDRSLYFQRKDSNYLWHSYMNYSRYKLILIASEKIITYGVKFWNVVGRRFVITFFNCIMTFGPNFFFDMPSGLQKEFTYVSYRCSSGETDEPRILDGWPSTKSLAFGPVPR